MWTLTILFDNVHLRAFFRYTGFWSSYRHWQEFHLSNHEGLLSASTEKFNTLWRWHKARMRVLLVVCDVTSKEFLWFLWWYHNVVVLTVASNGPWVVALASGRSRGIVLWRLLCGGTAWLLVFGTDSICSVGHSRSRSKVKRLW